MTTTGHDVETTGSEIDEDDGQAHYVDKTKILHSTVHGTVLVALCGYRFVSKCPVHDLPVCRKCADLLEFLKGMS